MPYIKISLWKEDALAALVFASFMIGAPLLVLSLDRQVPLPKTQPVQRERVIDNPLGTTWIEQSGNDAKGRHMQPRRHYTFAADLTRERK